MTEWVSAGEPSDPPVSFADLPPEAYPFRIMCLAPDDRTVVFHEVVESGPAVLEIPGLGPGSVHRVIVLYGDGTWEESTE